VQITTKVEDDMKLQRAYSKTKRVTVETGPGLTEQAHKNETDMNYILRDYQRTGLIKHAKLNEGRYDDIAVQDFQEAMFIVKNAQDMFDQLPSNIRKRFQNNPAEFLAFVQNPENEQEMRFLGILEGNDGFDISGKPVPSPTPNAPSGGTTEQPTAASEQ
jgi:phage internal scaffolding protein